jgi:hypothetical protein
MPIPSDMASSFPGSDLGSYGAELFIPWLINGWYPNAISRAARTGGNVLNTAYLHIFNSGPDGCTIDQLDANVTTIGTAGAVTRAGIYRVLNQSRPFAFQGATPYASLVQDAGTQPTDGSTGRKGWTLVSPVVVQPNIWFGVVGVDQVALAVRSIGNNAGATWSPWGSGTPVYNTGNGLSLSAINVTGFLPDPFIPGAFTGVDSGIGIHRSA